MGDWYRDEWARRGGEYTKAYGDGYADGRCFEAPLAEERGMHKGIAAYVGLMGMFGVLGARERAKPLPPVEGRACSSTSGRYRCNLDHEGGDHKAIGRTGRVLHSWP